MLMTKEHYDLMGQFERDHRGRMDREPKESWPRGIIYQDGHVNELFSAYRRGYAFAVADYRSDLQNLEASRDGYRRDAERLQIEIDTLKAAKAGQREEDAPPASAPDESQREGYPHDDPQFVALCREHDILGTAMQGLAAVFWRAASAQDDAKDERQAFEAWLYLDQTQRDPDDMNKAEIDLAREAFSAGLRKAAPAAGDALGEPNDLIERLLDAQQDLNQIANETMSQTLCSVSALLDEIEVALRRQASRPPSAPSGAHAVPAEVKAALDRMCTPLDTSWLTGITAIEDARCMKVILDYIVLGADAATRNAQVIEALRVSLQALEAIGAEMTVGERYTNAGQYLIDALPLARAALAAQVPQQGEA